MRDQLRRAFDWFFRSREDGRIVVAQLPNLPLWIFIASAVLRAVSDGDVHRIADIVATVALVWWATDELARGVNPWRRFLGAAALALTLARLLP